jgi:urate oxidase
MPNSSQAALSKTSYGKSRIRLVQVSRRGDPSTSSGSTRATSRDDRHELRDLTVAVAFEGEYDTSYTEGDNRDVLPTDTMKNTVYALAARDGAGEPEAFGMLLGRHFIDRNPKLIRVIVDLVDHGWSHIADGPREHGQAFVRRGPDSRTAQVVTERENVSVTAGVADLIIMKTSRSAFAGYPRDEFTTLPETHDRLLATALTTHWTYGDADVEFGAVYRLVRTALLDAFARHDSLSVQHTLYAMGQVVLDSIDAVSSITLEMPNRHHLPIDLTRFGMENRNEIFVATEEPHGLIKATLSR